MATLVRRPSPAYPARNHRLRGGASEVTAEQLAKQIKEIFAARGWSEVKPAK
jgi:hypothetical protein